VLGEVALDRLHAVSSPDLDPVVSQVVFDPVEVTHTLDDRPPGGWTHEPNGPFAEVGTAQADRPGIRPLVAPFLIVNPHSGQGRLTDELVAEAKLRGIRAHVLAREDEPEEIAREADAEALGMAGGDGSLAPIAQVAIDRDLPFVCVPFGTRNHFARDIGLDRDDPIRALDAFVGGEERSIDVGRANGRLFLNNVCLGIYAGLVHRREAHRRRSDAFARLRALAILAQKRAPLGITIDGRLVETRVVLVSNNAYDLELLSVGGRERIDAGLLHLYIPRGLWRRSWVEREGERFTIDATQHRLEAAFDGEPEELETPIEFTIAPVALRVLTPLRPIA
jgi:diacylglycerol kinase family enzyme